VLVGALEKGVPIARGSAGKNVPGHHDENRLQELLRRVDEVTRESERLRERIERIRGGERIWPDERQRTLTREEAASLSEADAHTLSHAK
jgi:hypothetical protein